MNYELLFCSKDTNNFDKVIKLFIETVKEADYLVETYSMRALNRGAALIHKIEIIGSQKPDILKIAVDFDDYYTGSLAICLSPATLEVPIKPSGLHYWAVIGSVFRIVPDLSTAYFTSFLIDKKMNAELAQYKQHTIKSLPLKIQELLTEQLLY
jgi:hypothetical protein